MLDRKIPVKFITFLYRSLPVRAHLHTDTGEVYFVFKDICHALQVTNPSSTAHKIPQRFLHRHAILTNGGKQTVIWIRYDGALELANTLQSDKAHELAVWIDSSIMPIKQKFALADGDGTAKHNHPYTFKDPVVIERSTIEAMLDVYRQLQRQGLI